MPLMPMTFSKSFFFVDSNYFSLLFPYTRFLSYVFPSPFFITHINESLTSTGLEGFKTYLWNHKQTDCKYGPSSFCVLINNHGSSPKRRSNKGVSVYVIVVLFYFDCFFLSWFLHFPSGFFVWKNFCYNLTGHIQNLEMIHIVKRFSLKTIPL